MDHGSLEDRGRIGKRDDNEVVSSLSSRHLRGSRSLGFSVKLGCAPSGLCLRPSTDPPLINANRDADGVSSTKPNPVGSVPLLRVEAEFDMLFSGGTSLNSSRGSSENERECPCFTADSKLYRHQHQAVRSAHGPAHTAGRSLATLLRHGSKVLSGPIAGQRWS